MAETATGITNDRCQKHKGQGIILMLFLSKQSSKKDADANQGGSSGRPTVSEEPACQVTQRSNPAVRDTWVCVGN
jgi:hypothetical protein